MSTVRYEVDPQNRLVVGLPRFRKVLDGRFKISGNNTLTYQVKSPLSAGRKVPHQVKLKGDWSLDKDHNLKLTFDKWGRQASGDALTLQGEIIDAGKNSLLFALTTKTSAGSYSAYLLQLQGAWQADKFNRLSFRVDRSKDKYDLLVFGGAWQINDKYQIVYEYRKEALTRKLKKIHTLTFKGYWDIKDKARISYVIDKESGSGFDFETQLGVFRDNYIKYELGIMRQHKKRPVSRKLTFFGTWKISKGLGLVFEVESAQKKIQALVFGAEAKLTDKDTLLFKLKNEFGRGIGAELELSHRILKGDGQAFLRLVKSRQEAAIFAGAGWRW